MSGPLRFEASGHLASETSGNALRQDCALFIERKNRGLLRHVCCPKAEEQHMFLIYICLAGCRHSQGCKQKNFDPELGCGYGSEPGKAVCASDILELTTARGLRSPRRCTER